MFTIIDHHEVIPRALVLIKGYCHIVVTAAALVAGIKGLKSPVKVTTLGGELEVTFRRDGDSFKHINLVGPAKQVFTGTVPLQQAQQQL